MCGLDPTRHWPSFVLLVVKVVSGWQLVVIVVLVMTTVAAAPSLFCFDSLTTTDSFTVDMTAVVAVIVVTS